MWATQSQVRRRLQDRRRSHHRLLQCVRADCVSTAVLGAARALSPFTLMIGFQVVMIIIPIMETLGD